MTVLIVSYVKLCLPLLLLVPKISNQKVSLLSLRLKPTCKSKHAVALASIL